MTRKAKLIRMQQAQFPATGSVTRRTVLAAAVNGVAGAAGLLTTLPGATRAAPRSTASAQSAAAGAADLPASPSPAGSGSAVGSPRAADAANVAAGAARSLRSDFRIKADDGREVRISTWPAWGRRRGLILFSHGALSAPEKYERVIGPWNAAGFEVMAPLHVDSTDHPDHAKSDMLGSWRARLLDMRALSALADAPDFIAAGHSYGGLVALTLGGAAAEVPPGLPMSDRSASNRTAPLRDMRATAVVAFSPPGAAPGLVTLDGYGALAVPAFIQTGDRDIPFIADDKRWQAHLAAYEAAPAGDKYALVLQGVDHYFGGLICKFDAPGPPQDVQLTAAVALSTTFIDAYGMHEPAARELLEQSLTRTGVVRLSRK